MSGIQRPWRVELVGTSTTPLATPEGTAYWRSFRQDVTRLADQQTPRTVPELLPPSARPGAVEATPPRAVVTVMARSAAAAAVIAQDAMSTDVTRLEVSPL